MFTVEKDKSYTAIIRLAGMETWASNDMLMQKFEELRFTNVNVTGSGDRREAVGTWTDQTTTVSLPSQVTHAEEVKLVFDGGSEKKSDAHSEARPPEKGRKVEEKPQNIDEYSEEYREDYYEEEE